MTLPHLQPWHGLTLLHIAAVTLGLLLYVSLTHSGRQRRPPSAALAWVVALIAFPYLSLPIYLLLGTRKLAHQQDAKRDTSHDTSLPTYGLDLPAPQHCTFFDLHSDGQQALDALISLIDRAKHTIDVEIFILRNDGVGLSVLAALARAVQRGVQVRLLLDGLGAWLNHRLLARKIKATGVHLRWFSPLRLRLHPQFGRGNLRNHRKLVVVDQHHMWSGGRNFASEYFTGDANTPTWHDLSFSIEGGLAREASFSFAQDWAIAGDEPPQQPQRTPSGDTGFYAQLLPSGPERREDTAHALYINAFHRANIRIWLATPYFVPDDALQQALLYAAKRGVHVRLLIPAQSNHRMADIARRRSVRELMAAGVHVHLLPAMLHAKLVIVDQTFASCGSINLDGRSLFLNYELNTLFFDDAQIGAFATWFEQQANHASDDSAKPPGWLQDVTEGIVRSVGFQL